MRRLRLPAIVWLVAGLACTPNFPAFANILILIDKPSQSMTVSVDGQVLYSWPVSTGANRSVARTKRGWAWSSAARCANIPPDCATVGSSRQAAGRSVSAFVIPRSSRSVAQSADGLFVFWSLGSGLATIPRLFASRDRSSRQRNFGIEAAPLRLQHSNLTKGLSSHHSLGEGND